MLYKHIIGRLQFTMLTLSRCWVFFLMRVSHLFAYVNAHLLLNAIYIQGLTSNHCKDSRLLLVEGK